MVAGPVVKFPGSVQPTVDVNCGYSSPKKSFAEVCGTLGEFRTMASVAAGDFTNYFSLRLYLVAKFKISKLSHRMKILHA